MTLPPTPLLPAAPPPAGAPPVPPAAMNVPAVMLLAPPAVTLIEPAVPPSPPLSFPIAPAPPAPPDAAMVFAAIAPFTVMIVTLPPVPPIAPGLLVAPVLPLTSRFPAPVLVTAPLPRTSRVMTPPVLVKSLAPKSISPWVISVMDFPAVLIAPPPPRVMRPVWVVAPIVSKPLRLRLPSSALSSAKPVSVPAPRSIAMPPVLGFTTALAAVMPAPTLILSAVNVTLS